MDKIKRATEIHRSMTPHQMALRIVELEDGVSEIVEQAVSEHARQVNELKDALELAEEAVRANHFPDAEKMVQDGCAVLMTLDEAIDHANEKSIGSSQCAAQHAQLAKWLTDYRAMLVAAPKHEGGAA